VNTLFKTTPLVAILGAAIALADPASPTGGRADARRVVDGSWTSRGFAERLRSAADRARSELREAPEVAWADVVVRSDEDHAPLRVEASIRWARGAELVPAERKEALLSTVRSWFESFACVDVVLPEAGTGEWTR